MKTVTVEIKPIRRHTVGVYLNGELVFTGHGSLGRAKDRCNEWIASEAGQSKINKVANQEGKMQ